MVKVKGICCFYLTFPYSIFFFPPRFSISLAMSNSFWLVFTIFMKSFDRFQGERFTVLERKKLSCKNNF